VAGALQQASGTVPIVFVNVTDPVGRGYVASLAQPVRNATGFTSFEFGMGGKWLEVLKEIAPRVTRAAVLRDPAITAGIGYLVFNPRLGAVDWCAGDPSRCPHNQRHRTRCRGLRAHADGWLDRDGRPGGNRSSRSNHHACCSTSVA